MFRRCSESPVSETIKRTVSIKYMVADEQYGRHIIFRQLYLMHRPLCTNIASTPKNHRTKGNIVNMHQLGGCPFNGPLSVMKYPTRESPRRDAASPIKYNGLRVPQPSSLSHCAQTAVPYRNIMD